MTAGSADAAHAAPRAPAWIGTSWKMNKVLRESLDYAGRLAEAAGTLGADVRPFVVPPYTSLREVKRALGGTRVAVGAQNMHWDDAGPWTGEVSAPMLVDCGADLVELGHSERRAHFGETDRTVGMKVRTALRHGLMPLICVGETWEQRQGGRTRDVLAGQTAAALGELDASQRALPVLVAYEPVWAIGALGRPATPDDADEQHRFIKSVASDYVDAPPPVLYGGSVSASNAASLLAREHVDGLFIGRAAWQFDGFLQILRIAQTARAAGASTGRTS
jgi:triosephosphate isomerase